MGPPLRSLYVCYLTLDDPLVHTQVVAYLAGLVRRGHTVHLLTFDTELTPERRSALAAEMRELGVGWHSLRYHKRPSLPATVYDVLVGTVVATRLVRRHRLAAVHARNHVPAALGLMLRRLTGVKLIFDIRGLMAEEYVDAGRWKAGGLPDRLTTWIQRAAIRRADGLVMLTHAVHRRLLGSPPSRDTAAVIPTCADLDRIDGWLPARDEVRRELGIGDRPVMIYVGKFTGRYMDREMVGLFAAARRVRPGLLFLVLTQSDPQAITGELEGAGIPSEDVIVTSAPASEVGRYLAAADFGICLYQPKPSEVAASPTKVGEYLGAGLPFVATAGIGDLDALVEDTGVGVVMRDFTEAGHAAAASAVLALAADDDVRARCRAVAHERFSLREVGVPRYDRLYRQVASR